MGMDVGSNKGGAMATMNVVPLIDILLVLLIIFMVITPLTPKGLDALVPQPSPANQKNEDQLQAKTIVVQVMDSDKLKINEEDATWDTLEPRLNDIFSQVARAIDVMRSSGIDKVGLITARLEAGQ
jgi:biopolymer transport protein ExbD